MNRTVSAGHFFFKKVLWDILNKSDSALAIDKQSFYLMCSFPSGMISKNNGKIYSRVRPMTIVRFMWKPNAIHYCRSPIVNVASMWGFLFRWTWKEMQIKFVLLRGLFQVRSVVFWPSFRMMHSNYFALQMDLHECCLWVLRVIRVL